MSAPARTASRASRRSIAIPKGKSVAIGLLYSVVFFIALAGAALATLFTL